jgi:hypothetical protein
MVLRRGQLEAGRRLQCQPLLHSAPTRRRWSITRPSQCTGNRTWRKKNPRDPFSSYLHLPFLVYLTVFTNGSPTSDVGRRSLITILYHTRRFRWPCAKIWVAAAAFCRHGSQGRQADVQGQLRGVHVRAPLPYTLGLWTRLADGRVVVHSKYALNHDSLAPVSKSSLDGRNGWGATIVDSMSTMHIMGLEVSCRSFIRWATPDHLFFSPFAFFGMHSGSLQPSRGVRIVHRLYQIQHTRHRERVRDDDTLHGRPAERL